MTNTMVIDFLHGKVARRVRNLKNDLLLKAIGKKSKEKLIVLDATAGLATDAFVMAYAGCEVIMLERAKVLADLIETALKRYHELDPTLALKLIKGDAISYLYNLASAQYPEVIYLDPMFEAISDSLPKKEAQLLRSLVPQAEDTDKLFLQSLARAKNRVVVKRPLLGNHLADKTPSFMVQGTSIRFDVYLM